MISWLMRRVTMKRKHCLFIDRVDGKEVFLWVANDGTEWMGNFGRFGFMVKRHD